MLNDSILNLALQEAAVLLRQLPHERQQVQRAQAIVKKWREQYPQLNISLLVDNSPGSPRIDYDLLLTDPDLGTFVITWQGDGVSPWTVCHTDHWAANYVVTVNEEHLTIQKALMSLRMSADLYPDLLTQMVNQIVLSQAVRKLEIEVTMEELQAAATRFRQAKGLFTVQAMYQWLSEMNLQQSQFEEILETTVQTRKLKELVVADQLAAYFAEHHQEYDLIQLFEVRISTEELAFSLLDTAKKIGLLAASQKILGEFSPSILEGALTTRYAYQLPFQWHLSTPGTIIGPDRENQQYLIAEIYSRQAAQLTGKTLEAIKEAIYQEWLSQQRSAAHIQWHWMN